MRTRRTALSFYQVTDRLTDRAASPLQRFKEMESVTNLSLRKSSPQIDAQVALSIRCNGYMNMAFLISR